MKPKVFISSTIYDFKDLRSALKYWINEMGYETVLSDSNDFNVTPNQSSYDACLKEIENCEYFILLIGSRAGGFYDKENQITITMQEYNIAYNLAEQGKIKIIPFVRRSIWDVREDRKALNSLIRKDKLLSKAEDINKVVNHESNIIREAEVIFKFINLITKADEMKTAIKNGLKLPKNNWVNQFNSFDDIVTTLKVQLGLTQNLSKKILLFNLKNELENTISLMFTKNKKGLQPIPDLGIIAVDSLSRNINEPINISYDSCDNLFNFCLFSMRCKAESIFTMKALSEGLFLNYNAKTNSFQKTYAHQALLILVDEVNKINSNSMKELFNNSFKTLMNKLRNSSNQNNIMIETTDMRVIGSYRNALHNILELSKYIINRIEDEDYNNSSYYSKIHIGKGTLEKPHKDTCWLSKSEIDAICKE